MVHNEKSALADGNAYGSRQDAGHTSIFFAIAFRVKTTGGYAQRHLEHSDYYDEQRRVRGEWHGRGAELLGLRGEVTREKFEAMREGLHPETEEFLRPRHSADRAGIDGTEQSKRRRDDALDSSMSAKAVGNS